MVTETLSKSINLLTTICKKLDETLAKIEIIEKQIEAIETELWGYEIK